MAQPRDGDARGRQIFFHDYYGFFEEEKTTHVFCGRCSMRLVARVAEVTAGRRFARGLDLCTGSGVQGLSMSGACDEVVLGDVNPRALAFARANARANGVSNVTAVRSDLFESSTPSSNIVTANTPFLLLPDGSKALSGYGGHMGMEVELRLYEGLDAHLNDGGLSLVVASSAIVAGENLLVTRLGEIFRGKGFDIGHSNQHLPRPPTPCSLSEPVSRQVHLVRRVVAPEDGR